MNQRPVVARRVFAISGIEFLQFDNLVIMFQSRILLAMLFDQFEATHSFVLFA